MEIVIETACIGLNPRIFHWMITVPIRISTEVCQVDAFRKWTSVHSEGDGLLQGPEISEPDRRIQVDCSFRKLQCEYRYGSHIPEGVATVTLSNKEPVNIVHLNGKWCISLSIYKETKFNTVKAVDQINEAMEKSGGFPLSTDFGKQPRYLVRMPFRGEDSALIRIILAVRFCCFLRRVVPPDCESGDSFSIIATFNLMYFNHLTINIMTLGGLALGAGMLVDNAIVVIENIFRHHEGGASVKDAAVNGTSQVGGAIVASTLTTIVVFLPIVYLHGASGELFKDQAWVVAFSLFSSLFAAIFLIPMLYHRFYRNKPAPVTRKAMQMTGYGKLLQRVLNAKWLVLVIALVLTAASFLLVPLIGSNSCPRPS